MHDEKTPTTVRPYFDISSWHAGYHSGYHDGHSHGEALGEQALRDRLLRRLHLWGHDLRLGLHSDVETPAECLHQVELLVEDRRGGRHGSGD
jgi:hypothetical protein